jgi:hypothetical protein
VPALALLVARDAFTEDVPEVPLLNGGLRLDERLDDDAWRSARDIGVLLQREPREGAAASERTEVKLFPDDASLYLGIVCHDSDPGGVVGAQMARDADLSVDDSVEIVIDTFRDLRNGYYFEAAGQGQRPDQGSGADLLPFFSRRIGLNARGEPLPVLTGAKLAGRAGDWNIGLLDIRTRSADSFAGRNFAVARVSRNVGRQSLVGAIATHGSPEGAERPLAGSRPMTASPRRRSTRSASDSRTGGQP